MSPSRIAATEYCLYPLGEDVVVPRYPQYIYGSYEYVDAPIFAAACRPASGGPVAPKNSRLLARFWFLSCYIFSGSHHKKEGLEPSAQPTLFAKFHAVDGAADPPLSRLPLRGGGGADQGPAASLAVPSCARSSSPRPSWTTPQVRWACCGTRQAVGASRPCQSHRTCPSPPQEVDKRTGYRCGATASPARTARQSLAPKNRTKTILVLNSAGELLAPRARKKCEF